MARLSPLLGSIAPLAALTAGLVAGPRSAHAEPMPYAPWSGTTHEAPPPLPALDETEPGPEPRELARRPGELGARSGLAVTPPLASAGGVGSFAPAFAVVALGRPRPEFGVGVLASRVGAPVGADLVRPGAEYRAALLLRFFPRDRGGFEPSVELGIGATSSAASATTGSDHRTFGGHSFVGGHVAWSITRSLRIGGGLSLGGSTYPGDRTREAGTRRGLALSPELGTAVELTWCFGSPM